MANNVAESEQLFRGVLAAAPMGALVVDEDDRIKAWNERAERLFGWSKADAVGRSFRDLVVHPRDRDSYRETFAGQRGSDGATLRVEVTRPDGTDAIIELSRASVGREHLLFVRDVSHELRGEADAARGQRVEAIVRLAVGILHDLNNLLSVIIASGELLLRGLDAEDSRRSLVCDGLNAATCGARLTRRLLSFTQVSPGHVRAVDINPFVEDIGSILRRILGEDVEVVFALSPDTGIAYADICVLEQTFLNLAVNARQAMPSGGTLTIRTSRSIFSSDPADPLEPTVTVELTDTRAADKHDALLHIFDPHLGSKTRAESADLGLATIRALIERQGGRIFAESTPGQGCRFVIQLPACAAKHETGAPSRGARDYLAQQRDPSTTVLLVEDDPRVRRVVQRLLKESGFSVVEAGEARAAIHLAKSSAAGVHLLLCDVVLPDMSGVELSRHIEALYPRARTLFMSGYGPEITFRHGVSRGSHVLSKPFTCQGLLRSVDEALHDEAGRVGIGLASPSRQA